MPHAAPARSLALHGIFIDRASGQTVQWQVHHTAAGLVAFTGIGVMAGMFGIGAGWANVPVLNLLMGTPLKLAAGTSGVVLSLVDSSAAWVYLHRGAVLPMIAVPSVLGMMLGARIGAQLLHRLDAKVIRKLVMGVLLIPRGFGRDLAAGRPRAPAAPGAGVGGSVVRGSRADDGRDRLFRRARLVVDDPPRRRVRNLRSLSDAGDGHCRILPSIFRMSTEYSEYILRILTYS